MMSKKRSAEKQFEISVELPGANIPPKRKSVLYWKVFEERIALPNYADEKALTAMYITVGRRNFWKLVKSGYPVIRPGRRHRMKSSHGLPKQLF